MIRWVFQQHPEYFTSGWNSRCELPLKEGLTRESFPFLAKGTRKVFFSLTLRPVFQHQFNTILQGNLHPFGYNEVKLVSFNSQQLKVLLRQLPKKTLDEQRTYDTSLRTTPNSFNGQRFSSQLGRNKPAPQHLKDLNLLRATRKF